MYIYLLSSHKARLSTKQALLATNRNFARGDADDVQVRLTVALSQIKLSFAVKRTAMAGYQADHTELLMYAFREHHIAPTLPLVPSRLSQMLASSSSPRNLCGCSM